VRRITVVAALVALIACGLALPVSGQPSANGSIRGYVRDATGAALPGATVTAAGAGVMPFAVVSDSEGYYRLLDLPPGEYQLSAERQGFARFVRPAVVARAVLNLSVDIELAVGFQSETTTVRAETPMLESSSAVQAVNIAGELQRDVPLTNRRDWADSLLLVPGMVAVTQPGSNKYFYYLHGADFSSLGLEIDGADMASTLQNASSYISLSDEAIHDSQVKTGAIDASTLSAPAQS